MLVLNSLSSYFKMYFHPVFLIGADTYHPGRVDTASFSTQSLMELFIQGIENLEVICGSAEEPDDIDKWEGLMYRWDRPIASSEKHVSIKWLYLELVGTVACNGCHQPLHRL